MKRFLASLGFALTLAYPANANDALDVLQEIRLTQGPQAALTAAQTLVDAAPLNASYLFERGVAEAELGQCVQAWRTLNQAVLLSGRETARQARDAAMQDLCPAAAPWEGQLDIGIIADSNYNNATSDRTVLINGLPFSLSDDARASERYGLSVSGYLGYNIALSPGQSIVAYASGNAKLLNVARDNEASLTFGAAYRRTSATSDWRAGPSITLRFDNDGLVYTAPGLTASGRWILNDTDMLSASASIAWPDATDLTQEARGTVSWMRGLENGHRLYLGASFLEEDTIQIWTGLSSQTLFMRYQGVLTPTIGFELHASHTWKQGQATNPIFGVQRNDTLWTVGGAVSFAALNTPLGRPYIGLEYTESSSNIALHRYDKTSVLFGISRTF